MAQAKAKTGSRPRPKTKSSATPPMRGKGATMPLVAGGAALASAAGGVALGAKLSGRKVLGVRMPKSSRVQVTSGDVAEAARSAAGLLERLGALAGEARAMQGEAGDGLRRSPLEVLLQGLTARR